jgi:hypothetical protein
MQKILILFDKGYNHFENILEKIKNSGKIIYVNFNKMPEFLLE